MTTHLDPHLLERLRRGALDSEERRRLEGHLSEGCPGCSHAVARILVEREPETPPSEIVRPGDLVRRHLAGQGPDARLEELVAPGLAAVLVAFEEPEAFRLISEDRAYQTMALASHLTDASNRWVIRDMVRAYHLSRRAVAVAAHVSPSRYGSATRFDLQGEAAMALANASRCRSRFYEARRAMSMATSLLEQGSGDVQDRMRLASLEASLASDLGYPRDALLWLRESERFSTPSDELGQPVVAPVRLVALIQRANFVGLLNPSGGARLAEIALSRADPEAHAWLHYCASRSLIALLSRDGQAAKALPMLVELDRCSRQTVSEVHRLRSLRLRAEILGRLHRYREAVELIEAIKSEFDRRELGTELAETLMNLGEICLLTGRRSKARRVIGDAASMFSMLGAENRASMVRGLLSCH